MSRPTLRRLLLPAAGLLAAACTTVHTEEVQLRAGSTPAVMNAPEGNPLLINRQDADAINYNVSTSEELEQIDNGAEGEVYFTDPTNPDKVIEGIEAAFAARRSGNGWLEDYAAATRLCRRKQRPLLIWFHDSVLSPKSKQLGAALLNTAKFNTWCNDRIIRLKLDSGAEVESNGKTPKYSRSRIRNLARSYGLTKTPALAVITPNGKLMASVNGFDGFQETVQETIEKGVEDGYKEIAAARKRLEAKGYRDWSTADAKMEVFAKFHRYDTGSGKVYLKQPGGKITGVKLDRLRQPDIDFVEAQSRH